MSTRSATRNGTGSTVGWSGNSATNSPGASKVIRSGKYGVMMPSVRRATVVSSTTVSP